MSKMFGQLWRGPFGEINTCLAYSYFAIVNITITIFPIDDIFVTGQGIHLTQQYRIWQLKLLYVYSKVLIISDGLREM